MIKWELEVDEDDYHDVNAFFQLFQETSSSTQTRLPNNNKMAPTATK